MALYKARSMAKGHILGGRYHQVTCKNSYIKHSILDLDCSVL